MRRGGCKPAGSRPCCAPIPGWCCSPMRPTCPARCRTQRAAGAVCAARGVPFALDAAQTAGHLPLDFAALQLSALSVPASQGAARPAGHRRAAAPAGLCRNARANRERRHGQRVGQRGHPRVFPRPARARHAQPARHLRVGGRARLPRGRHGRGGRRARPCAVRAVPRRPAGHPGRDDSSGRTRRRAAWPCSVWISWGRTTPPTAARLEEEFGILTRCGLHCAPNAHRTLGTFPRGTVRLSFGWFNTAEDADAALRAVRAVSAG